MENISKDMDELFWQLQEKYSINEYVEISTCNRKEYYINHDLIQEDCELLSHENQSIIIEYGESAVMHLLRMTSGLESMIVGEDQILGQVKDAKNKAVKNHHCGRRGYLRKLYRRRFQRGRHGFPPDSKRRYHHAFLGRRPGCGRPGFQRRHRN